MCDRWNKYNSHLDTAKNAVIRATQYLVRPSDGFPTHSPNDIRFLWEDWSDQEKIFWYMTMPGKTPPTRIFPEVPDETAEPCCFHMWGLLIQVQVDNTHGKIQYLRRIVAEIAVNESCKNHPSTCACHVPNNPWTFWEDVEALAPIMPEHNPYCQCAAHGVCAQKDVKIYAKIAEYEAKKAADPTFFDPELLSMMIKDNEAKAEQMTKVVSAEEELAAHPELKVGNCRCEAQYANIRCSCLPGRMAEVKKGMAGGGTFDYQHNIDTCACGTCYKARVDSGTQEIYETRVRQASEATLANLVSPLKRQETFSWRDPSGSTWRPTSGFAGLMEAAHKADVAIASSGSINDPDFAKNLFAAMGTPHDSKCPHGMPFYACMSCSH